jgi:hypothetical protein
MGRGWGQQGDDDSDQQEQQEQLDQEQQQAAAVAELMQIMQGSTSGLDLPTSRCVGAAAAAAGEIAAAL